MLVPEDWDQYLDSSEWSLGDDGLPFRTAARVLVVTRDADILLLVGHDAANPDHTWVFTPGGGLRPGEDPRAGAVRELAEESGIDVAPVDLEGPVAHREAIFRFASVTCRQDELYVAAKELGAPYELVAEIARTGHLPVVLFTAGGIATPADAAMMMQMGAEGVFVGSGIFKSGDPAKRAAAIVRATAQFDDPDVIAEVSRGLGEAMVGINVDEIPEPHRLAERGW